MAMDLAVQVQAKGEEESTLESNYMKGVRHLSEGGITRVPTRYILPLSDRPEAAAQRPAVTSNSSLSLPTIDLALLKTSGGRSEVIESLARACEDYGFFQVVNHGIPWDVSRRTMEVGREFFELPFEERVEYMSTDIRAPVRYGTSFNQMNDGVFYWRDFLKLNCQPLAYALPHWPSSPTGMREEGTSYAMQMKSLFLVLMEAILEALGLDSGANLQEFEHGSHMMVLNCYPACPEPDLTLGMPPHSDYGFLTILLQDDVEGLQVQCRDAWVTVEPVPNSLVVNVGDHLEIFSNGRYKSVLHRVMVNSSRSRASIASLHSLPYQKTVSPQPELVTGERPRLYKDTNFAAFLDFMTCCEAKHKNFLESRKLTPTGESQSQLV